MFNFGTSKPPPIAARLPAEPGWLAVTLTIVGLDGTGESNAKIEIVDVASWAIRASEIEPLAPEHTRTLGIYRRASVHSVGGFIGAGGLDLDALDANGAPIANVVQIVAPGKSHEDVLRELVAWVNDVNAATSRAS